MPVMDQNKGMVVYRGETVLPEVKFSQSGCNKGTRTVWSEVKQSKVATGSKDIGPNLESRMLLHFPLCLKWLWLSDP